MKTETRIPQLSEYSFDAALLWFAEMQQRGLLFHPDDDPADIIVIASGEKMLSDQEADEARAVIDQLFAALGENVYEAAYPVMMKACGQRLDA
ncbi:MAG: hypothetical protein HC889_10390 [Synechococcaceae cyanobacterium SM1_2_3]|nr:hypothetical protein [Synechococcaceae cyanobacterium SM1_2_3]